MSKTEYPLARITISLDTTGKIILDFEEAPLHGVHGELRPWLATMIRIMKSYNNMLEKDIPKELKAL